MKSRLLCIAQVLLLQAGVTSAWCQGEPDVFNVQPNIEPLTSAIGLKGEDLRAVRLVAMESALAYGDSLLSASYRLHRGLVIGQNPWDLAVEEKSGRVEFVVRKEGILHVPAKTTGTDDPHRTTTVFYDHSGNPRYYALKSDNKVFVKKANYEERGSRIGKVKKKHRAKYPESEGYRIEDGVVWLVEPVFVSWGNLMSVHVSADGNTLRFYLGISPDPANLTASVRKTGTIGNWVDYLEQRRFQGTAISKQAYLGSKVSVTAGDVTWHRDPGEELLLGRELSPESFVLFSVIFLGDVVWSREVEEPNIPPDLNRREFVYKLGAFEARVGAH